MSQKHLIVVAGPTAVGKTSLSIALAKHFDTEILSADSRQLYQEMAIGTAKPTIKEMDGVKHHFVDCYSIKEGEPFSASKFEREALTTLTKLFETKSVVIMAGGSGLYVNAICQGFDEEVPSSDPQIREQLIQKLENEGIEALQEQLNQLDPAFYQEIDLNNPKRLMRALEVCLITGKPYSGIRKGKKVQRPFNIIKVGLERDRQELYQRINIRVDQMMNEGLESEVKSLIEYRGQSALSTVGYTEIFKYFDQEYSLEEAVEKIKVNSRRYAKRQLTWFKKDVQYNWFHPDDNEKIVAFINSKLAESPSSIAE